MKTYVLILLLIFFNVLFSFSKESKLVHLQIELKGMKGIERIDRLNQISELLRKENPVNAKIYINEALKLSYAAKYYKGEATALINLGVTDAILGDYEKAEAAFKKSLNLFQSIGDKYGINSSMMNLGHLHMKKGDYKESLVELTKAFEQIKIQGDKFQLSKVTQTLGNLQFELNDFNKALEYYNISIKLNKEQKNYYVLAQTLNSIGTIYYELSNYGKAISYFKNALGYINENDKASLAETIYNNFAISYSELGEHAKALEYYHKSLQLAESIPEPLDIAVTNFNIGNEYSKIHDMDKAKYYIDKSIAQLKDLDSPSDLAYAYHVRGSFYFDNHLYSKAEADLNLSLSMYKELGSFRDQKEVLALLSESYILSNNNSLAAKTLKEYRKVSDNLINEEKTASLEITNAKIAAVTEIERLNGDLVLEKERYVRLSLILFSVLILIALSITFFFVAKRMSRKLIVKTAELNVMKENSKYLNESFAKEIKEQMFQLGYYIFDSGDNPHYKMMKKSYDNIAHSINDTLLKYNTFVQ